MPSPNADLPALNSEDLEACLAELRSLYAALDMTTFPRVSLEMLNRLIPGAAFSSYNEIDMRTAAARVFFEPEHVTELAELHKPGLWIYRDQHPIMRRYEQGMHDGVWKISDFLEPAELHGLDIYREVLAKLSVEDTLAFTLQSNANLKVFYAISGPQNFTERDRAVAARLQPHLVQAFENALAFTDARALALLSTRVISEAGSHGLLLVDRSGRIVHANERAGAHLAEAFIHANGEAIPPELRGWLEQGDISIDRPNLPFEVAGAGYSFLFRSARADAGHWIIATRRTDEASLSGSLEAAYRVTRRQADVLLWLSRGKTNSEIASILDLSERTVAKHLQHLFVRLGVENRHSATLKVTEVLGLH